MNPEEARELVGRHAGSGVAVDTSLLLLLWVGCFDRERISRFKRTMKYAPENFDLLRHRLAPLSRITVTPHTLTEVDNFAGQLPEETCLRFRHKLVPAILRCDERRTAAAKLAAEDWYPRLGITDTALVDIARDGVLVVTDDLPLFLHLSSHRWPVLNFTRVLRTVYGWK